MAQSQEQDEPEPLPRRRGYQGRGGFDPAGTLFPCLEGQPLSRGGWWTAETLAAAQAEAAESYAWWRAWNAEHPPDRTCPACGELGGRVWLTTGGVGPRPWHQGCTRPAQPLRQVIRDIGRLSCYIDQGR